MTLGADVIVTARRKDQLVGVSRALSDFAYCTYLSDLAVDQRFSASRNRAAADRRDPQGGRDQDHVDPAGRPGCRRLLPAHRDGATRVVLGDPATMKAETEVGRRKTETRRVGSNLADRSDWRSWLEENASTSRGCLAGDMEGAHREAARLRRDRGGGALLRLDRLPGREARQRPLHDQVHAPQAGQRLVPHQQGACRAARSGRPDDRCRPGSDRRRQARRLLDVARRRRSARRPR